MEMTGGTMKYRLLTAVALCCALSAAVQAQDKDKKFALSFWGGYAGLGMSDVNRVLKETAGRVGSVTEIDQGLSLAAEGTYEIAPGLSIGPRVEYIIANQGKASIAAGPLLNTDLTQDVSLVPLMVGARYRIAGRADAVSLNAGIFAGWGLASGTTKVSASSSLLGLSATSEEFSYDGGGFVGDLLLGLTIPLGGTVDLGIDAGYRMAEIPEMKTTGSSTIIGVPKDQALVDASGNKIKFDFSGLVANAGLRFRF
jgi:hypothetical protein